ncbi:DUF1819 family protein [Companilactobacillus furfuricola]|uniref:DUF1819 family protein n=1 Tax=Companilactobacillus furfuricola TaxID=1462575 RepID=UPI0013DDD210|nr:DUF1819 family protein [Companilactobacillus furfuricola]
MNKYSASMVSHAFWMDEFSEYIDLVNEGMSEEEIRSKSIDDNYFKQSSKSRARDMFNVLSKRVNSLDKDLITLFPSLDIQNQRLVNLISIMNINTLFKEFMYETYRDELIVGDEKLNDYEVEGFFNQKMQESDQVAQWTEKTIGRLRSVFKTFVREAGLMKDHGDYDDVIRPLIDFRLEDSLRTNQNNEALAIFLGR